MRSDLKSSKLNIVRGLKAGLPIGICYIPISLTFGILSRAQALPLWSSMTLSAFVFAGASQFTALRLLQSGTGICQIIFVTFFINIRHLLLSASLAARLNVKAQKKNLLALAALACGLTDESYAVIANETESDSNYILALQSIAHFSFFFHVCGIFFRSLSSADAKSEHEGGYLRIIRGAYCAAS
jgi:predicted branched-subunit amino acid permease